MGLGWWRSLAKPWDCDMKFRRLARRMSIVSVALLLVGSLSAAPAYAVGFPTVTTLDASPNPSPACGLVTITATVHGALFPDSPNGFVQFFDGASLLGGPQLITPDFTDVLGVKVGPTDHSSAFIQVPLSGGTHVITAGYAGPMSRA